MARAAKITQATQKDLEKALRTLAEKRQAQKDANNDFNRTRTVAKNTFKAHLQSHKLPETTALVIDGVKYSWGVTETEKIDAAKWYEMFTDGQITIDVFLDALSVSKDVAKDAIGEDQVLSALKTVRGSDADIRMEEYPEKPVGVHLLVPDAKAATLKHRPGLQRVTKPAATPAPVPPRRVPVKLTTVPTRRPLLKLARPA